MRPRLAALASQLLSARWFAIVDAEKRLGGRSAQLHDNLIFAFSLFAVSHSSLIS